MDSEKNKEEEMFNINNSPQGYLAVRDYLKKTARNAPPNNEAKVHKKEH
ncbi:hypothetical protein [Desulfolucanica intricata]|nr:hypothetical protein [Desulfolucanica intricata]